MQLLSDFSRGFYCIPAADVVYYFHKGNAPANDKRPGVLLYSRIRYGAAPDKSDRTRKEEKYGEQ